MRKKKFLLIILLLLGVGFATVATTLVLTGDVNIATNNENFDVIFTKAVIDGVNLTSTAITDEGKKITFNTKDLITVGDISKLDFMVRNNSEMYDSKININCVEETNGTYFEVEESLPTTIAAKTSVNGYVHVKLSKAPVENVTGEFTCTLNATAVERTEKAERVKYVPKYFEHGEPTTSSTQDYNTLRYPSPSENIQATVFLALDDENQKSVCIVRNGVLDCFKKGVEFVEDEQAHLKEVFGKDKCLPQTDANGPYIFCEDENFGCDIHSSGYISCYDYDPRFSCDVIASFGDGCYDW